MVWREGKKKMLRSKCCGGGEIPFFFLLLRYLFERDNGKRWEEGRDNVKDKRAAVISDGKLWRGERERARRGREREREIDRRMEGSWERVPKFALCDSRVTRCITTCLLVKLEECVVNIFITCSNITTKYVIFRSFHNYTW